MFLSTFVKTKLFLEEFKNDERGVTAIEYAIIGVAIAAIVAAVFGDGTSGALLTALNGAISTIAGKM